MMIIKKYVRILEIIIRSISEAFEEYFIDDSSKENYKSIRNSFIKKI